MAISNARITRRRGTRACLLAAASVAASLVACPASADEPLPALPPPDKPIVHSADTVVLTDGTVVTGTVTERVAGSHVTIVQTSGEVRKIPWAMVKDASTPAPKREPPPAPRTPPTLPAPTTPTPATPTPATPTPATDEKALPRMPPPLEPEAPPITTTTPDAPTTPPRVWYGYQPLIADAGALLLVGIGAGMGTDKNGTGPLAVGVITYALVPPIIHLIHDNGRGAGVSLALRVGGPFVGLIGGAFLGAFLNSNTSSHGDSGLTTGLALGVGTTYIITVAVDAAVLSYDTTPPKPKEARKAPPSLAIAPQVGVQKDGLRLGLGATF